jgi:hypothetical protein
MNELLAANVDPDSTIGGWSPLTRAVLFGQERALARATAGIRAAVQQQPDQFFVALHGCNHQWR